MVRMMHTVTHQQQVANADQLLIVVALADPPPRTGLVAGR